MEHAKRTLIIGHTGQDGRILWDQLAALGHSIIGTSRHKTRYHAVSRQPNLENATPVKIASIIKTFRPDHVYYLAAYHHSSQDEQVDESKIWQQSWHTHVHAFEDTLRAIKASCPMTRVFYASSSRIFGHSTTVSPQNEKTPWAPTCAYGTTKAAGMLVANFYRRVYGMHISCGILYNHESTIRNAKFVSQKIIEGLVAVKLSLVNSIEVGSLEARVDWGYAPDYTRAMYLMLMRDQPSDLIIATGETHSVRDLASVAARRVGLNLDNCIVENKSILRRCSQALCGDSSRLRAETGWEPSVGFEEMVNIMADSALQRGFNPNPLNLSLM